VDDYLWLMGRACYKPVIEYCGGTEIGGGFITGSLLQPQALSAFSTPAMGCNLFILDSNGNPLVSVSMEEEFCEAFSFHSELYDHIFPTNIHNISI
jgi:acyl-coenzyme A synthetase/AMP-(fatty) acid ligase